MATSHHGHGEPPHSSTCTIQLAALSRDLADISVHAVPSVHAHPVQLMPCLGTMHGLMCAGGCRYGWFGDHNLPWQTDLNTLNNTVDWNKINAIMASPNAFDNRDPAQTGGGFGLLPWYLRSAAIPARPLPPSAAPGTALGPAPAAQGQAAGG